ncbi:2'-5' RNA ligase family protein [Streptomyces sp. HB132]|uniref:2'-5' RNA ligase family protein n=1 Tax=Streptomyces sp. HB132 TaxID=767388 RepID=UPI0019606E81|nr:2'-5' RNA ligase family protein [Streptomyces sp. HB132]MBM7439669.1 2'-5' RNA ligase [Streptomyces sp. HB132]
MHSVELLPDGTTDRRVREVWRRLADEGLPSQAAHRHPTNRPHLTLATADTLPAEIRARLKGAFADLPTPLRLDGLLRFSGRTQVLAWEVRPDDALLHLHETVWRIVREVPGSGRPNPLLDPVRWVPHITLGRGRDEAWAVPDNRLLPATSEASAAARGRWTEARYYDSVTRTTGSLGPGPE